jgi:hypothetical protein
MLPSVPAQYYVGREENFLLQCIKRYPSCPNFETNVLFPHYSSTTILIAVIMRFQQRASNSTCPSQNSSTSKKDCNYGGLTEVQKMAEKCISSFRG